MTTVCCCLAMMVLNEVPTTTFLTQAEFDLAVDRPLISTQTDKPVRQFLQQVSQDFQVAVLLDRRIDPSSPVSVAVNAPYLDVGLNEVVQPLRANVVVLADTIFVAPHETAAAIRSHIAKLEQDLNAICKDDRARQLELSKRHRIAWEMLTSPKQILNQIEQRYELTTANPELLPHDLWPAGQFPSANATEGLMLVLIQFKLGFRWVNNQQIELIPLPETPLLEQLHRPRGIPTATAERTLADRFPHLQIEKKGTRFNIMASIEEHEAIAELLGERKPRRSANHNAQLPDKLGTFSLKMVRKPFLALVQSLQQQGVEIRYNAAELEAAGIDVEQKISLELKQATLEVLLKTACDEVGATFRMEGESVIIAPGKTPN